MKFKLVLGLMFLVLCVSANSAQTELTIKKKTSIKIPGMPAMPQLPEGMKSPLAGLDNRKSVVYIKGSRMRDETKFQGQKKSGGKETVTQTTIVQCDKQHRIQFTSKKRKYYLEPLSGETSATVKNAKKGGYVTVTGSVTDTGERAKLFGYDARHLKETITITPSKDVCQKEKMQIEIEGWYADVPEFSCPMKRNPREFQMGEGCFDDVDFQMKGGITGIPLKEIKKISMQGMTMIIEEEATEILKTPLADSLFEPPANYKAANTLKEVEDDSPDDSETTATNEMPQTSAPTNAPSPTLSLPQGGIEKPPLTEKKTGMIRIGVVKPKVTTPDSKKDPAAGDDIASATKNLLVESLKAENVEAIQLDSENVESEAREKGCDYIFYANITQKRGGGGMFKSMVLQGAIMGAGMIVPGIGGMIVSTVGEQVMGKTMEKNAKAKDEFTLDYKVVGMDKTVLTQAVTKSKTENDGEDVMSPQIKTASTKVLAEINKRK
jgi:hypothetical protein